MANLFDRNGRKISFLKLAIPCWIDSVIVFGMIGHTLYLEANRPLNPDPTQGFVIAQTVNRTTHYLTQADQIINGALWGLTFVSALATVYYFWRIGLLPPRRAEPGKG